MGYDIHLEQAEEEYQKANRLAISLDAAVFVRRGYSRPAAMAKAREISETQREADDDIRGVIGTLAEAQSPIPPADNPAQTQAIAKSLRKEFDGEE